MLRRAEADYSPATCPQRLHSLGTPSSAAFHEPPKTWRSSSASIGRTTRGRSWDAWSSNVAFKDGSSEVEVDLYAVYERDYEAIQHDIMLLGYLIPGVDRGLDQGLVEVFLALAYDAGFGSVAYGFRLDLPYVGNVVGSRLTTDDDRAVFTNFRTF
jgi:hypothetical protein